MDEQDETVERLFGEAVGLPRDQRTAFLEGACAGEPALRRMVEDLLDSNDRLSGFLSEPGYVHPEATTINGSNSDVLSAGSKLGRYTVIEPLGTGGMGAVYKARDEKLERVIAIKILSPGVLPGAEARRRFRKEALALAKLSHPNIAPIYDVGEQNGVDYIIMECVAGQTLAAKLQSGPLAVKEATSIVLQIAQALEEAHEQGVVHRDLKPANVMINPRGHVKVLDFGIAKLLAPITAVSIATMTQEGVIIGTPLYMSPEQAQGQEIDARTDLWSLGVIYYESLTGATPFHADSNIGVLHAIVTKEPSPLLQFRPDTPPLANAIVLQSLAKDPADRYQSASETIRDASTLIATLSIASQTSTAGPSRFIMSAYYYVAVVLVLVAALAGAFFYRRSSSANPPAVAQWEQLTFFTDSALYPALSPDGRMLAFIRGSDSFLGPGDVYVKLLPGGEPVQLTHDSKSKLAPSFAPDSSSIVYSIVPPWDTWQVPVLGGDPHLFIPNSSSLTWFEQGKRMLFSEIRGIGVHMVVVTTDEDRRNSRDVYVPVGERSMAHHSYLSPDGKWVLIVEMDSQGKILPCRIVPFPPANVPPTNEVKLVGPPNRTCLAGAWSPDGQWIYLTANEEAGAVGRAGWRLPPSSHIWRQRFPDGQPEQLTFGPTSQEGIAMASDGRSLVTSVGSLDRTVWMHDRDGDHQISSEGNASAPSFSADGRSLYFLMANGQTHGYELWVKDISSGKVDRVLPGSSVQEYSVSRDGEEVVFTMADQSGLGNLWVAPTSRRSPPVRISSAAAEDSPFFLPNGDVIFRAVEGGSNFLYRMKADGSGRQKVSPEPILDIYDVSPDGRWVAAGTPGSEKDHLPTGTRVFAVDGTAAVTVCAVYCLFNWDTNNGFVYLNFPEQGASSYGLPVIRDSGLPKLPPSRAERIEDFPNPKTIAAMPVQVESAVSPSVYAYTRENTRRNLYRISLP